MKFLHIGNGNHVNIDKIYTIVKPNSAPMRRQITNAADKYILIDCTKGKKTQSVIFTDKYVVLSFIQPNTLIDRYIKNE